MPGALATGNTVGTARRVVPDIAANAEGDELVGYTGAVTSGVYGQTLEGGTSAATRDVPPGDPADPPTVIGAQPGLGDGNDYLTTLGEDQSPLRATRGYDDETGLGTPGPSFVTAFKRV
ncbi:MAG TPA: hypothetical protein VE733_06525 [Streptosporangiaceae bacterium]|nr:hypothetical protein [Streptosporangiaceae bacterium]